MLAKAVPVFLNMFFPFSHLKPKRSSEFNCDNVGVAKSERALQFQLLQLYLYCFQPFTVEITI